MTRQTITRDELDACKMPIMSTKGSLADVQKYIERLPKRERLMAYVIFGMTVNTIIDTLEKTDA